jgi:hypothetical protein
VTRLGSLLLALVLHQPVDPPVRVVAGERAGQAVLLLLPAPGVRLGARSVPVLELEDGRRLAIGHGARTADSAYFAEPPWVPRPSRDGLRGMVRLGFCLPAERFCRLDSLPVRMPPLDAPPRRR